MNILLLGAPDAGKGTLAKSLQSYYSIAPLSTGDMFRQLAEEKNPEGLRARDEYWGRGHLVPDEQTTELVRIMLAKEVYKSGVILDGYPRTIPQAKSLEEMISDLKILHLDASEENLILRAKNRRVCKDCKTIYSLLLTQPKVENTCDSCSGVLIKRQDDEKIGERIEVYKKQTFPLLEFYGEGRVKRINADKSPEEVFSQAISYLSKNLKTVQN
jgi:adenylate kinase